MACEKNKTGRMLRYGEMVQFGDFVYIDGQLIGRADEITDMKKSGEYRFWRPEKATDVPPKELSRKDISVVSTDLPGYKTYPLNDKLTFPNRPIIPNPCREVSLGDSGSQGIWDELKSFDAIWKKLEEADDFKEQTAKAFAEQAEIIKKLDAENKQLKLDLGALRGQVNFNAKQVGEGFIVASNGLQATREALEKLESQKMDRPSVARELIDAEIYIDDFNRIARTRKRQSRIRQERIQRKLNRIKGINQKKKPSVARRIGYAVIWGSLGLGLTAGVFSLLGMSL